MLALTVAAAGIIHISVVKWMTTNVKKNENVLFNIFKIVICILLNCFLFLIFLNGYKIFSNVKQAYDLDFCVDTGICSQGIEFKDELWIKISV